MLYQMLDYVKESVDVINNENQLCNAVFSNFYERDM